jgi:hypothetical protein
VSVRERTLACLGAMRWGVAFGTTSVFAGRTQEFSHIGIDDRRIRTKGAIK